MAKLNITLKEDRNCVVVSVAEGENIALSAAALTSLILQLIGFRACMTPPVVDGKPREGDPLLRDARTIWSIGRCRGPEGGLALMLGHPGLGWSRIDLTPDIALKLAQAIPLLLLEEGSATKQ